MPAFLPDVHDVREDLADYLGEALAWDSMVHEFVEELKERGQLDNTLIIVSGDHGMPGMPRGKCNLHDFGSKVSLLVSWPARVKPGRRVEDFVSLADIAPTVLEATGIERPDHMLARSFVDVLVSDRNGLVDETRDHVVIGRERHVGEARRDRAPYPSRALRTADYLLVRNFAPDRTPMGDVYDGDATADELLRDHYLAYPDMDASPTKVFLMTTRGPTRSTSTSPSPSVGIRTLRPEDRSGSGPERRGRPEVRERTTGSRGPAVDDATGDRRSPCDRGRGRVRSKAVRQSDVRPPAAEEEDSEVLTPIERRADMKRPATILVLFSAIGARAGDLKLAETDDTIRITLRDKPVLEYVKTARPVPDGIAEHFGRSGYIHPVFSPTGQEITGDFPPDHAHQHALFFAWTKATFDGRKVDFWNQAKQLAGVEYRGPTSIDRKDDRVSFSTRHAFTVGKGDDRVRRPPRDPGPSPSTSRPKTTSSSTSRACRSVRPTSP